MREKGLRRERLASAIRETLSQLLLLEMRDPRLAGVVVSAVELSKDLKRARAYFSLLGDAEREREVADGLGQARGLLRREVGRRLHLRVTPELDFLRDQGFERADRVERILGELTIPDAPVGDEEDGDTSAPADAGDDPDSDHGPRATDHEDGRGNG